MLYRHDVAPWKLGNCELVNTAQLTHNSGPGYGGAEEWTWPNVQTKGLISTRACNAEHCVMLSAQLNAFCLSGCAINELSWP